MATVNSEQSAENMEYVRRLLKQKQPGFSAALESTVDLVGRELESPTCCATSALPSLDPPTNSWTGGNNVSKSRLRSARGCLAAHLSCCQPTLAACPNFACWVRAKVADGPSGAVTKVLTGQAGAGAARRRQRNRFIHWRSRCHPSGR